jgi:hypothetical protein
VQLSDFDKSRVRYHLGYFTVSVPAGDYARLEEAMNTVPDSYFYDKIAIQIGRCDTAEKKTEVATSPSTRLENIAGDVDRTIRSSNAKEATQGLGRDLSLRNQPFSRHPLRPQLQGSVPSQIPLRTLWR